MWQVPGFDLPQYGQLMAKGRVGQDKMRLDLRSKLIEELNYGAFHSIEKWRAQKHQGLDWPRPSGVHWLISLVHGAMA
jgi:hypothetical protein